MKQTFLDFKVKKDPFFRLDKDAAVKSIKPTEMADENAAAIEILRAFDLDSRVVISCNK
jgi:hypothetical protein